MNQPSGLKPTGGQPVNRAESIMFEWTSDGEQSAFDLRWRPTDETEWRNVSLSIDEEQYEISGVPYGEIEWQVRTYDPEDTASDWSDVAIFFAGDKPETPEIIRPSGEVNAANITAEWSSSGQVAYLLEVEDGEEVFYSHEGGSGNSHIVEKDLEDEQSYTFRLSIQNEDGLWSDEDIVSITVAFQSDVIPFIESEILNGAIEVSVSTINLGGTFEFGDTYEYDPEAGFSSVNDDSIGGYFGSVLQHSATEYDVYRDGMKVAKEVPVSDPFKDFPASGKETEYTLRVRTEDGTYADSEPKHVTADLRGVWLQDIQDPESLHQFKYFEPNRSAERTFGGGMMQFEGRQFPVAEFNEREEQSVSLTLQIKKDSGDIEAIRDLISRRSTLLYRDAKGRRIFCVIFTLQETEQAWGWLVPLDVQAVHFDEVI
ncbi:hypothetical protein D7Z54_14575 [Salibacterium salarium]|uniref:Fibronectin type-III domain-containing protein n=1 Tax=Salibacterium salarium TaxID=284579 RepID=A0A428N2K2_9BACI|nr:hypothetical protein [Salibacterium salarium]RSL32671.1 hypothetical protein D7Z54_14575 [Salibacterium salarium]